MSIKMLQGVENSRHLQVGAVTVIVTFVIFMILGVFVIPFLDIKLQSSKSRSNTLLVTFDWHKASAEMVEKEVTTKLEGLLNTITGVEKITSISRAGSGNINVELNQSVNLAKVRHEAATLMRHVYPQLPNGVSFPFVGTNHGSVNNTINILSYTITGPGSTRNIKQFAEKSIIPILNSNEDLSKLELYGGNSSLWEIRLNKRYLKMYGLSYEDVANSIRQYLFTYEPGSTLIQNEISGIELMSFLKLKMERKDSLNWASIPIVKLNGRIIYLTDISNPIYVEQEPTSYYRVNGDNTVNLLISAKSESNIITVTDEAKDQLKKFEDRLPVGYSLILKYDASKHLKEQFLIIIWQFIGVITILFLFVFMVSKQSYYVLVIAIALMANLLISGLFYYLFKIDLNAHSLTTIIATLGLLIGNYIVTIGQVRNLSQSFFLKWIGAALINIGAVFVVLFTSEPNSDYLFNFTWIIIINLIVSIVVSVLFIPALIKKIPLRIKGRRSKKSKLTIIYLNQVYIGILKWLIKYKKIAIVFIVLLFGTPLFMLPVNVISENAFANVYNGLIGNSFYTKKIRPWLDICLGGTLRVFMSSQHSYNSSSADRERTSLSVNISMPKGTQLHQMNLVSMKFEKFLKQFKELQLFQTRVNSGQQARIDVFFDENFENSSFPEILQGELERMAATTGLATFDIKGIGQAFNNKQSSVSNNQGLIISGFNYNELRILAEKVKNLLLQYPRVENVVISSDRDWSGSKSNFNFVLDSPDPQQLLDKGISVGKIQMGLSELSRREQFVTTLLNQSESVPVILRPIDEVSSQWQILNEPIRTDSTAYIRFGSFAKVRTEVVGEDIKRENQEYHLVVNYHYIADYYTASLVGDKIIKDIKPSLQVGYTVKRDEHNLWTVDRDEMTWMILYAIVIIYAISAILLESVWQPLVSILLIPVVFIGVFLSAWLFEYSFDDGCYVAFILLSGLIAGYSLYLFYDFRAYKVASPHCSNLKLYVKSFNSNFRLALIKISSIVISLIPFIVYAKGDRFWYTFSMGMTGGLLFSILALVFVLPLFLKLDISDTNDNRNSIEYNPD